MGFSIVRMAFIGNFNPKRFLEMDKKNPQLRPEEFEFLKSRATLVREMGMQANRTANLAYNGQSMTGTTLNGGSANWAVLSNTEIANGRYLTEIEVLHHMPVAVIGADVKDATVRQRRSDRQDDPGSTASPFTVIGVAKAKGSAFGQSQDAFVDIPDRHVFPDLRLAPRAALLIPGARPDGSATGAGRDPDAAAGVPAFDARSRRIRFRWSPPTRLCRPGIS